MEELLCDEPPHAWAKQITVMRHAIDAKIVGAICNCSLRRYVNKVLRRPDAMQRG